MRQIFSVLLFLTISCGSTPPHDDFETIDQGYNGPPPKPIVCESPRVLCGTSCVDISRDNMNCGDCDNVCEVSQGEFCLSYYCRDVRNYGFYFGPAGPVEYDVRRDLPRPPRFREEDR
jgi:hypothetical protein